MRLRVTGDIKLLEPALEAFAKLSDETYKKTAVKWEKRLKSIPTIRGGTPQFPTLHFDALPDTDKSMIFFVSSKTPMARKFFGRPKRRMEKDLRGYLKDIHKIEAEVEYIGD